MRLATIFLSSALIAAGAGAAEPAHATPTAKPHICPTANPTPRAAAGREFDARRLVGKRVRRAKKIARRHGCIVRVVKRNGEWQIITQDLRSDRINVVVRDGRVRRIHGVY